MVKLSSTQKRIMEILDRSGAYIECVPNSSKKTVNHWTVSSYAPHSGIFVRASTICALERNKLIKNKCSGNDVIFVKAEEQKRGE